MAEDPNTERRIMQRRTGITPIPPETLLYYRATKDRRNYDNSVYDVHELRMKLHQEWKYTEADGYHL